MYILSNPYIIKMNPDRLEIILDGWWQERKQELLERLMSEIRANVRDGPRRRIDSPTDFTQEIYVPSENNLPHLSMFSETILPPANTDELARVGMNLLNFSLGSILNMFPEVPILPNPEVETNIREVMAEPTRRRNFFANFSIPDSLDWPVVVNRSLPVQRLEEDGQECSICLDTIYARSSIFPIRCGHQYHCHCLSRVLCEPGQPKCPLCRNNIEFIN